MSQHHPHESSFNLNLPHPQREDDHAHTLNGLFPIPSSTVSTIINIPPPSPPPPRFLAALNPKATLQDLPRFHPQRLHTYIHQEIAQNIYLDIQLLALTLATGTLDAISITHSRVFVSKQTGNTVFLALAAVRQPLAAGIQPSLLASLVFFLLGAALDGHLGGLLNQRRRLYLVLDNLVQTGLTLAAAALLLYVPAAKDPTGQSPLPLLVVALLSFTCGAQIAMAVRLGTPDLNTTMVTGALVELATDRQLFRVRNGGRNRRVAFYLCLLVGALVGAVVVKWRGPGWGLVVVAGVKGLVAVSFLGSWGVVGEATVGGGKVGVGSGEVEDGTERKSERSGSWKGEAFALPMSRVLWGD